MKHIFKMLILLTLLICCAYVSLRADGGATGTSCCHWGGGVQCCTLCKPAVDKITKEDPPRGSTCLAVK